MDLSYELITENKEERTRLYKINSTGKTVPTRDPKFRDRDKVYAVMDKIKKSESGIQKVLKGISVNKKISVEELQKFIESGEGLSEKELNTINEASEATQINTEDQEVLICSILNLSGDKKEAFMDSLSMVEGIAVLKLSMEIYNETMVTPEERKK